MKRDLARLLEAARRRGWRVERTNGSPWKLRHPNGGLVFASSTTSSPRALRHPAVDLRRVQRARGLPG